MKPIFLSEIDKEEILKEFTKKLDKEALYDGTLSFERSWSYGNNKDEDPAVILYTPEAYMKTVKLISEFDSEIAWHALAERTEKENEFLIYDVLVYPQKVTGTTVNTDQEEYTNFLIDLTEEEANAMHVQCHSHVNMSTSPSSVDTDHQSKIVKSMNTGFYIFQIWNKKLEVTSWIYDMDNNIMYENKDIIVNVVDEKYGIASEFVRAAKKIVKNTINGYKPSTKKESKTEKKEEKPWYMKKNETDPYGSSYIMGNVYGNTYDGYHRW